MLSQCCSLETYPEHPIQHQKADFDSTKESFERRQRHQTVKVTCPKAAAQPHQVARTGTGLLLLLHHAAVGVETDAVASTALAAYYSSSSGAQHPSQNSHSLIEQEASMQQQPALYDFGTAIGRLQERIQVLIDTKQQAALPRSHLGERQAAEKQLKAAASVLLLRSASALVLFSSNSHACKRTWSNMAPSCCPRSYIYMPMALHSCRHCLGVCEGQPGQRIPADGVLLNVCC